MNFSRAQRWKEGLPGDVLMDISFRSPFVKRNDGNSPVNSAELTAWGRRYKAPSTPKARSTLPRRGQQSPQLVYGMPVVPDGGISLEEYYDPKNFSVQEESSFLETSLSSSVQVSKAPGEGAAFTELGQVLGTGRPNFGEEMTTDHQRGADGVLTSIFGGDRWPAFYGRTGRQRRDRRVLPVLGCLGLVGKSARHPSTGSRASPGGGFSSCPLPAEEVAASPFPEGGRSPTAGAGRGDAFLASFGLSTKAQRVALVPGSWGANYGFPEKGSRPPRELSTEAAANLDGGTSSPRHDRHQPLEATSTSLGAERHTPSAVAHKRRAALGVGASKVPAPFMIPFLPQKKRNSPERKGGAEVQPDSATRRSVRVAARNRQASVFSTEASVGFGAFSSTGSEEWFFGSIDTMSMGHSLSRPVHRSGASVVFEDPRFMLGPMARVAGSVAFEDTNMTLGGSPRGASVARETLRAAAAFKSKLRRTRGASVRGSQVGHFSRGTVLEDDSEFREGSGELDGGKLGARGTESRAGGRKFKMTSFGQGVAGEESEGESMIFHGRARRGARTTSSTRKSAPQQAVPGQSRRVGAGRRALTNHSGLSEGISLSPGQFVGPPRTGLLSSVQHHTPLSVRLNAVNRARLERRRMVEGDKGTRMPKLPEAEIRRLQKAFLRYDADGSGDLDMTELGDCLADLGLKPRTRAEKRDLSALVEDLMAEAAAEAPEDAAVGDGMDFVTFCELTQDLRHKMQETQRNMLLRGFLEYDEDSSGLLEQTEAMSLMEELGLQASNRDEEAAIDRIFEDIDSEGRGSLSFPELEIFYQRARERVQTLRRDQERRVRDEMEIPEDLFQECRPELTSFYQAFHTYDVDHGGMLDVDEIEQLLLQFGLMPKGRAEQDAVHDIIDEVDTDEIGELSFTQTLHLVKRLRRKANDDRREELRSYFDSYDRDGSGDLSMAEISKILVDLGLQPRNHEEQENIQLMMEEVDEDGTNSLDFEEFCMLFQKISEKLLMLQRSNERKQGLELGFSDQELLDFRIAYNSLDEDGDGRLEITEIRRAMNMMHLRVSPESLRNLVESLDEDGSGELSFVAFLKLVQAIGEGEDGASQLRMGLLAQAKKDDDRDVESAPTRNYNRRYAHLPSTTIDF